VRRSESPAPVPRSVPKISVQVANCLPVKAGRDVDAMFPQRPTPAYLGVLLDGMMLRHTRGGQEKNMT
jgi:hypothetical protein